jgi:hypothetical protein
LEHGQRREAQLAGGPHLGGGSGAPCWVRDPSKMGCRCAGAGCCSTLGTVQLHWSPPLPCRPVLFSAGGCSFCCFFLLQ